MVASSFKNLVERYKLKANGLEFWAPYWINEPGVRSGSFAGKGSAEELQAEVDKIFETYQDPIETSEAARYLMLRNGLGVECAGFIFHVIDDYLISAGKGELVDYLFVPKSDLLQAAQKDSWKKHREFSGGEKKSLPNKVPMRQVCEWFHREPAYITNVARLIDEATSNRLSPENIASGDLISFKSWSIYPHLGIVTSIEKGTIKYFSSDFDPVGPGGITQHEITINDLTAKQVITGYNGKQYTPEAVHRVKALA